MAGHSKWKNIQHRKGKQDKARSSLFGKLGRQITIAVRMGKSPDPEMNPRLRLAIQNAKGARMPKDAINRAVEKGAGGDHEGQMEDICYEGFGPHGVGFIIEVSTDNKNRVAAQLREQFRKNGGALGETGSVSFMFTHQGRITYPQSAATNEDEMMEAALEAGAEDLVKEKDENAEDDTDDPHVYAIYTHRSSLSAVASELQKKYGSASSVNLIWKSNTPPSTNPDATDSVERLKAGLAELDDVNSIYTNHEDQELHNSGTSTFQCVQQPQRSELMRSLNHHASQSLLPAVAMLSTAMIIFPVVLTLLVTHTVTRKALRKSL